MLMIRLFSHPDVIVKDANHIEARKR
jgi:hypothetical protein